MGMRIFGSATQSEQNVYTCMAAPATLIPSYSNIQPRMMSYSKQY